MRTRNPSFEKRGNIFGKKETNEFEYIAFYPNTDSFALLKQQVNDFFWDMVSCV